MKVSKFLRISTSFAHFPNFLGKFLYVNERMVETNGTILELNTVLGYVFRIGYLPADMSLSSMDQQYTAMTLEIIDAMANCKSNKAIRALIGEDETLLQNYNLVVTDLIKTFLSPKNPEAKNVSKEVTVANT